MNIHFNGYKARYQVLNQHMGPITRSHNIRTINIFINLDDLFHTLHRPLVDKEFQVSGSGAHIELVSNVFNLIGHYKNWATKNGYRCKIYAIYSSATHSYKNNVWVKHYRQKFFDINDEHNSNYYFINNALHDSYKVMHVISRYLKGIYIVDSKYMEPAAIPYFIAMDTALVDWNILISRDSYDAQYGYKDRWTVFSPKGDNTVCVTKENMWNYINYREHIYTDQEHPDLHYPYSLFPLAKAIVGDSYRNIKRLRRIGWKTLFKYLNKLDAAICDINDNAIIQEKAFIEMIKDNRLTTDEVNRNIYAIDVEIQYQNMLDLDKSVISAQLIDMEDFKNLEAMNMGIFHLHPINIPFLCTEVAPRSLLNIWK